ncbi:Short-chain dehydrogenase [Blastococcus sp. DSM 46786]|uniref:SDR family NAD(P)-dependent oxidoreductase n=1 Tax=Blastococcus sp. DSM 46786 TaxID=1798227 RepID=UPI0008B83B09|nr:SDR family oxidoreductase [Blastococcus sp. DSM 46786]SEK72998.1 Short-chain dehydrogenase [Blastococcus sp. DSM 46786]
MAGLRGDDRVLTDRVPGDRDVSRFGLLPGDTSGMGGNQTDRRPVALVTGASRGIGRRIALALAAGGYDVAFTARTLEEGQGVVGPRVSTGAQGPLSVPGSLAATTAQVTALGVRALPVRMDLLDVDSVRAAAERVHQEWGAVDLLVNNAITHLAGGHDRLLDLDPAVAARTLEGNFLAQLVLVQAVLPSMLAAGGGTMVNLCSGSSTTDPPASPGEGGWGLAYAASKAAFGRLAGAVNAEYHGAGVRAFNLDPGFVVTEASTARGGISAISGAGFELTPDWAAGAAVLWLARAPEAARFLGRVVWTPKLVAELGLTDPGSADPGVQRAAADEVAP